MANQSEPLIQLTGKDAPLAEETRQPDKYERIANIVLRVGAPVVIALGLVWFVAVRLDTKVDVMAAQVSTHMVVTEAMSQNIAKQTDVQVQTCIMMATIAKRPVLDCYKESGK